MRFSEKADRYEERAFIQSDLAAWGAKWLGRMGMISGPVLEVGAGTGLFTKHLIKCFPELVATDVSEAMVALGKERVPEASWCVCDAWSPDDSAWGGMFSASLLQWCQDPCKVFASWKEVLRPGALMLHAFFLDGTLAELRDISSECLAIEFHSAEFWKNHFESSGFEVVDSEVMQTSYRFPSTLDLFRFLHGIGATLGPRKLKPSSLRGIIEACDHKRLQNSQRQLESNWVFGRFLCRSI